MEELLSEKLYKNRKVEAATSPGDWRSLKSLCGGLKRRS